MTFSGMTTAQNFHPSARCSFRQRHHFLSTVVRGEFSVLRAALASFFFTASRAGDLEALVAVLDPDVVLRGDFGGGHVSVVRGAEAVAAQARQGARGRDRPRSLLVNGTPAGLAYEDGRPVALLAFIVVGGRIVELDILGDSERLVELGL